MKPSSILIASLVLLPCAVAHAEDVVAPPALPAPQGAQADVTAPAAPAPVAKAPADARLSESPAPAPIAWKASVTDTGTNHDELGRAPKAFAVRAGFRFSSIGDEAFDHLSDSRMLTQFTLEGSLPVLQFHPWSAAVGVAVDLGGKSGHLRGLKTSLAAHRFTAPVELRRHFGHWLYAFGRVAPGAGYVGARWNDETSPDGRLSDSTWVFTTDLSLGASLLLSGYDKPNKAHARIWVTPEVGYTLSTAATLTPHPDDSDQLGVRESTQMGSLALRGGFFKIMASLTF